MSMDDGTVVTERDMLVLFQKAANQLASIEAKGRFSEFDESQLRLKVADFKEAFCQWATQSPIAASSFAKRVQDSDIWSWLTEPDFELLKYNTCQAWDLDTFQD